MKKEITTGILALALVLSVSTVSAQKTLRFGVRGGGNVTNISGHNYGGTTMPRIGYNAGITVDYAATHNFYILSGVEFTTKGFETKSSNTVAGIKSEAMYVQLPVHAGIAAHVDENTKVIFHAGPHVAYGIAGDTKVKGTDIKQKTFNSLGLKKFDFGVGGGVDLDYKHFTIGLSYDHSVLDVSQIENISVYNSAAQVKVGVKF